MGTKRDYVRRADAGVHPRLPGEIDQLRRLPSPAHRRLHDCRRVARDGHDRAILIRVHGPIEQTHAVDPHGGHDCFNAPRISPHREVGNALDQWTLHLYFHQV